MAHLKSDSFAGSFTMALAAEETGRRWICADKHLEYVQPGRHRFDLETV